MQKYVYIGLTLYHIRLIGATFLANRVHPSETTSAPLQCATRWNKNPELFCAVTYSTIRLLGGWLVRFMLDAYIKLMQSQIATSESKDPYLDFANDKNIADGHCIIYFLLGYKVASSVPGSFVDK